MKANVTNLRKALKACAEAHKVGFNWWRNDRQMGLHSESVPVVADARRICEAFYGTDEMVEVEYGYTNVWLDQCTFLSEVNEETLALALPAGTTL